MSSRIFSRRGAAAVVGEVAVDDDGERVDGVAADEDVHLDHGRDPGAGEVVVERGVAAGDGLEAVVEVEDDLVERQLVGEHDAGLGDVLDVLLAAALVFDELEDAADVLLVGEDLGDDDRLFDLSISVGSGQREGLSTSSTEPSVMVIL
jgi:hypothetical protein